MKFNNKKQQQQQRQDLLKRMHENENARHENKINKGTKICIQKNKSVQILTKIFSKNILLTQIIQFIQPAININ